nr:T9SS type A sorting domain-containing protein [uncultured Flavobacterium sp.]
MLISSMGFSQNLITNGDFANGATDWTFSSPGVVSSGEAYFSNANAVGNPWDTELKQTGKSFTGGNTYTLTFRARAAANRNISVNIQNTGIWNDQFRNNAVALTTTMTDYSYVFVATSTNANAQLNFHMANMGTNTTAAVYIDDVTLTLTASNTCTNNVQDGTETGVDCGGTCGPCPVPPATAATTPPNRAPADVVSVFSDKYTNVVPSGVETFGAATYTNFTIVNPNDTRRLTVTANGQGMQYLYLVGAPLDLTNFTNMHIDFYIEGAVQAGQEFQVFLLNFGAWPSGAGSTKLFKNFDVNAIGSGAWYSADIALNTFNDTPLTRDKISLVQIVVNGGAGAPAFGPVYIDNIYFHKNTTLATKKFEIAGLNVYPNPARDSWTVTTQNINMSSIEVFDVLGKNVLSLKPNAIEAKVDASRLKTGVYFAKINTIDGSSTLKLVKE